MRSFAPIKSSLTNDNTYSTNDVAKSKLGPRSNNINNSRNPLLISMNVIICDNAHVSTIGVINSVNNIIWQRYFDTICILFGRLQSSYLTPIRS
jgi:hypothetical protein